MAASGIAVAPKGNGWLLQVYPFPAPQTGSCEHHGRGLPTTSSQHIRQKRKKTKEKKNSTPNRLASSIPYSSISSGVGSASTSTSASAPTPSCTTGISSLGVLGALAPCSLRGGGGDLHTLADWRAPLLRTQASACAPWGPPHPAHLAVPCAHGWPFPTRHPSTGQKWLVLCAEGAPGGCGPAVRGDVSPLAALTAEGVWPTSLLEGVDLIPASEQSDSALAKTTKGRLAENRGHHRRGAALACLEAGPKLRPAEPSDLRWDVHPTVLRLKLLPELQQAAVSCLPHVPGKGNIVDSNPLPPLLRGNISDAAVPKPGRL